MTEIFFPSNWTLSRCQMWLDVNNVIAVLDSDYSGGWIATIIS